MIVLSFVLTFFNNNQKLAKTVKSIESYGGDDIEIIIVDDGSETAPSFNFSNINVKVSLYRTENKGPLSARIFGASKACGTYVYFVDSGDEIRTDNLSFLCKLISNKNYDIYLINTLKMNGGASELNFKSMYEGKISREEMLIRVFSGPGGLTSSTISKTSLFFKIKEECSAYPKLVFTEDQFLSCKLITQAARFFQINDYIYIYCIEEGGLSTSSWTREKIDSYIYVYNFKKDISISEGSSLADFLTKNELAGLVRNIRFTVAKKNRLYFINKIKENCIREVFHFKNILLSKTKIIHKLYALYIKLRYKI